MSEAPDPQAGLISDTRLRELSQRGWTRRFMEQYPAVR